MRLSAPASKGKAASVAAGGLTGLATGQAAGPAVGIESARIPAPHAEPRRVLLAQSRRGYGNLAQWVTIARRRAPKGECLALRSGLEGKVPTDAHAGWPAGLRCWCPMCRSLSRCCSNTR